MMVRLRCSGTRWDTCLRHMNAVVPAISSREQTGRDGEVQDRVSLAMRGAESLKSGMHEWASGTGSRIEDLGLTWTDRHVHHLEYGMGWQQ